MKHGVNAWIVARVVVIVIVLGRDGIVVNFRRHIASSNMVRLLVPRRPSETIVGSINFPGCVVVVARGVLSAKMTLLKRLSPPSLEFDREKMYFPEPALLSAR